jgi:hypothetical protein
VEELELDLSAWHALHLAVLHHIDESGELLSGEGHDALREVLGGEVEEVLRLRVADRGVEVLGSENA